MTDPLITAARFLVDQMEWCRHRQFAAEVLGDIEAARRVLVGLIDGAAPRRYLGPCGQEFEIDPDTGVMTMCEGDVYAREHSSIAHCRSCGAEHDVAERWRWLDEELRSRAFRAAHIADAYRINVNTIRSWYARERLIPHSYDENGRPLFNVGDVLELAEQDAQRRAANEAKRAEKEMAA